MPRRRPDTTVATPQAADSGHVISPTAVYRLGTLQRSLGLRKSSLAREIRGKRLKVLKRCGIYFFLGEDVLAWLRGGQLNGKPERD